MDTFRSKFSVSTINQNKVDAREMLILALHVQLKSLPADACLLNYFLQCINRLVPTRSWFLLTLFHNNSISGCATESLHIFQII